MDRCLDEIHFRDITAEFSGDAKAIYPSAVAIGQPVQFKENYALVGLQLSSSLTIYGSNKGGIFLLVGRYPKYVTISNALRLPISHISGPNSITAPDIPIPASKVTSLSFGAFGVKVPSGTPLQLYAFADTTSGNDLFAICSLQLTPYIA